MNQRLLHTLCLTLLMAVFVSVAWAETSPRDLAMAERIVQEWAAGNHDEVETWFSPALLARNGAATSRDAWEARMANGGGFVAVLKAEAVTIGAAIVPVRFKLTTREVHVAWSGALARGSLTGFDVRDERPETGRRPPAIALPPYTDARYIDAASFRETKVSVGSGKLSFDLTLATPRGGGAPPVVLIVGEGNVQDSDGSTGPNKPWRDLARGLASRGIATARFAARRHRIPEAFEGAWTFEEELLADAAAALKALREQPRLDQERVWLLGVGKAAYGLADVAARDGRTAGLVLINPPRRHNAEIALRQLEASAAAGFEDESLHLPAERGYLAMLADRGFLHGELLYGHPAAYWYHLAEYKPEKHLLRYPGKMLILFGKRDLGHDDEDLRAWSAFMKSVKRPAPRTLDALNRYMIRVPRPLPPERMLPAHVSADAIDAIAKAVTAP